MEIDKWSDETFEVYCWTVVDIEQGLHLSSSNTIRISRFFGRNAPAYLRQDDPGLRLRTDVLGRLCDDGILTFDKHSDAWRDPEYSFTITVQVDRERFLRFKRELDSATERRQGPLSKKEPLRWEDVQMRITGKDVAKVKVRDGDWKILSSKQLGLGYGRNGGTSGLWKILGMFAMRDGNQLPIEDIKQAYGSTDLFRAKIFDLNKRLKKHFGINEPVFERKGGLRYMRFGLLSHYLSQSKEPYDVKDERFVSDAERIDPKDENLDREP